MVTEPRGGMEEMLKWEQIHEILGRYEQWNLLMVQ